ncbi:hypothetical protein D3C75_721900 [compost metagenome]
MSGQRAQARGSAIQAEAPVGIALEKAQDALARGGQMAAVEVQVQAMHPPGQHARGEQRDQQQPRQQQHRLGQPTGQQAQRRQRGEHAAGEAQAGLLREVDVGEQHVRRVQAARAVGVAGDQHLVVTVDDLLADRHPLGAVVGHLRLAARQLLAVAQAVQRLLGAPLGVGLRLGLAEVGPAEAAHGDLLAVAPVLRAGLGPVLWNDQCPPLPSCSCWIRPSLRPWPRAYAQPPAAVTSAADVPCVATQLALPLHMGQPGRISSRRFPSRLRRQHGRRLDQ